MFDQRIVWYLPVLPSEAHAAANMISLRAIDGDTSYHSHESFSLKEEVRRTYVQRTDFHLQLTPRMLNVCSLSLAARIPIPHSLIPSVRPRVRPSPTFVRCASRLPAPDFIPTRGAENLAKGCVIYSTPH